MPFDNSRNQARARNMAEALAHVETSAQANKASAADVAQVLAPTLDALARLGLVVVPQEAAPALAEQIAPPRAEAQPHQGGAICSRCGNGYNRQNAINTWTLGEIAAQAPLDQLGAAIHKIIDRLETAATGDAKQ